MVLYLILTALFNFNELKQSLDIEGERLLRQVSQRADQHDAHLSNLSALTSGGEQPLEASIIQVAKIIQQFYARVTGVNVISLADNESFSLSINTDKNLNLASLHESIRQVAISSTGQLFLQSDPNNQNNYLLIKRSPNTSKARFAIALIIDQKKLLEHEIEGHEEDIISLTLPEVDQVHGNQPGNVYRTTNGLSSSLIYEDYLTSASQPLRLRINRPLHLTSLISLFPALLFGIVWIGIVFILFQFWDMKNKTRDAQLRASLREQETIIAHASRVNALGEMASGITHELNQPLTALLSQSQAALRMLSGKPYDLKILTDALDANVTQAKRAGEIMKRLRNWIKKDDANIEMVDLNEVVRSVFILLNQKLSAEKIVSTLDLADQPKLVNCDSVQVEQVVFNLVNNAIEALANKGQSDRKITVRVASDKLNVYLEVLDNGPGIPEETRSRLLEPFFTTKKNGLGLGLSLCESILQNMQGTIEIHNQTQGGTRVQVTLLQGQDKQYDQGPL